MEKKFKKKLEKTFNNLFGRQEHQGSQRYTKNGLLSEIEQRQTGIGLQRGCFVFFQRFVVLFSFKFFVIKILKFKINS